jgi:Leucine-rich repeat (LRR) protein
MFLSSNLIETLDGIQHFSSALRVLSMGHNLIAKISELAFLSGLQLQNLNLEGNPVAGLPFYKFHVLAVVPTLVQLDGNLVKEKDRSSTESALAFDNEKLTQLCLNDTKLSSLRSLVSDCEQNDAQWLTEVQTVLGSLTFESFGMNDDDVVASFDQMRVVARDFRERQGNSTKWANVYSAIETLQKKAIEDMTGQLQTRVETIRASKSFTPAKSPRLQSGIAASESRNLVRRSGLAETPPAPNTRPPSDRVSPLTEPLQPLELELDCPAAIARLRIRRNMVRVLREWARLVRPASNLPHLAHVLSMSKRTRRRSQAFYSWKCRVVARRRIVSADEIELSAKAAEAEKRIVEVKAAIESEQRKAAQARVDLEESVKNERKMKVIIGKQKAEARALKERIRETEKKYESDVMRYMLEVKLDSDSTEQRISELHESLRRSEADRVALSHYYQETDGAHKREIADLERKLQSAFEITSQFRREITQLECQLDSLSLTGSAKSSPGTSPRQTQGAALHFF